MTNRDRDVVVVRLQNASLDDKEGVIVAHGWLDIEAIECLHVGDYQREVIEFGRNMGGGNPNKSNGRKSPILKGLEQGARLPDIILGMRGQHFTSRGNNFMLEDDCYIVDGLQRVSAMKAYAATNPELRQTLRIGAEVRFNTTRDLERDLFTALNTQRKAMSPNVLLRNARTEYTAVLTLYGLSKSEPKFALYGKVCWNQQMSRTEIVTAFNVIKAANALHSFFLPGLGRLTGQALNYPPRLEQIAKKVRINTFRDNMLTFFDAIDDIWGIRGIKYTDMSPQIRATFMNTLGQLFADHENFWDGNRLVIDAAAKSKLRQFPINDPTIIRLAGAGTTAGVLLYNYLRDHMNKSKRVNQLVPRRRTAVPKSRDEEPEE